MATISFTAGTVIPSSWLNDVNALVYGSATPPSNPIRVDLSGNVGIGQAATEKLDVLATANSGTYIRLTNASTGTSAYAAFRGFNGTNGTQYGHTSTTYTTSGAIIADGGLIYGEAAGGLAVVAGNASGTIRFATGGTTERVRIDTSGRLLLGKTSSSGNYFFDVDHNGAGFNGVNINDTDGSGSPTSLNIGTRTADSVVAINLTAATVQRFRILRNGNVENFSNSYGAISDARLKENIVDSGSQWDDIKNIRIRKFKLKDDSNQVQQLGVVAQEVQKVSPGLVTVGTDENQTLSVQYSVLYMKAVKALQEAMERIEVLEAKVASLTKE